MNLAASPPGELALRAECLCKRYGERWALREVGFQARAGESLAVIGPNGAGKTTLLSVIAGVQSADCGSVDRPRAEIGWVPQQPALYAKLSVAENLRLFARLERVADVEAAVGRMLEQTGLRAQADDRVGSLSGGNRQRVNIALGLLADPPVLLLDEPSTALDPAQRQRLWEFVGELTVRGRCVIFSTHIVSEAARHAQRALVLDEGRLLYDGAPGGLAPAAEDFEGALVAFLRDRTAEGSS